MSKIDEKTFAEKRSLMVNTDSKDLNFNHINDKSNHGIIS